VTVDAESARSCRFCEVLGWNGSADVGLMRAASDAYAAAVGFLNGFREVSAVSVRVSECLCCSTSSSEVGLSTRSLVVLSLLDVVERRNKIWLARRPRAVTGDDVVEPPERLRESRSAFRRNRSAISIRLRFCVGFKEHSAQRLTSI
jgi:hypothetical protein